jgi:hypothetical protein
VDPEDKKLLEDNLRLSEENNKLLRSLHRSMRVRRVLSIVYWVFIIGSAIGAYYFIEPYVGQVKGIYDGASSDFGTINGFLDNFRNTDTPR